MFSKLLCDAPRVNINIKDKNLFFLLWNRYSWPAEILKFSFFFFKSPMCNIFWRALGTSQKYSEKSCNMFKPFFPDIAPLSFYSSRSLACTPADKTCRGPWSPSLPSLTTHWQMSPPVPHGLWYQISQFQILSDIKPEPKYLMVADFMRYYSWTTISHGYRFCEILLRNDNISWLQYVFLSF